MKLDFSHRSRKSRHKRKLFYWASYIVNVKSLLIFIFIYLSESVSPSFSLVPPLSRPPSHACRRQSHHVGDPNSHHRGPPLGDGRRGHQQRSLYSPCEW